MMYMKTLFKDLGSDGLYKLTMCGNGSYKVYRT